jgi:PmbA protein
MTSLDEITEELKSLLPTSTVDASEIYTESRQYIEIQAKNQEVDFLQKSSEIGVAVRLEKDGRIGFGYINDLSRGELERVVAQSYNSLQNVEPKHPQFLPELKSVSSEPRLNQFDEALSGRSLTDKISQALLIERSALDCDKRIKQVRNATYQEEERNVLIWNSHAGNISSKQTLCQAHLMVVAGDESEQEASWNIGFSPYFDKLDCKAVAEEAAKEAIGRLQAGSISTGQYPAVLDRSVIAAFMGILAPSFLGESVQRKKSQLMGKLKKKIYADNVTIVDDGLLDGGMMSSPFDGEGFPSQKTVVVSEGILNNYLYDTSSGRIDGMSSTGNSMRSGFKEAPHPGTRNLYLKAGTLEPPALYDSIENGVAIHDVIGMHTANPITGDFSVGASGYLIRNGKRAQAIRGFAISGNLHHIFSSVEAVGSDLKFYGSVGAPSVRVNQLTVGGT